MKKFEEVLIHHMQLHENSCIPSGVEIILKVLEEADMSYYGLQTEWGNRADGSFASFHEKRLFGVRFKHRFFDIDRGPNFPIDELFRTISNELSDGRYVLVSLSSPSGWHIYLVVEETNGEFLSVSKKGSNSSENLYEKHTREIVRQMGGTDILTYEVNPEMHTSKGNVLFQ